MSVSENSPLKKYDSRSSPSRTKPWRASRRAEAALSGCSWASMRCRLRGGEAEGHHGFHGLAHQALTAAVGVQRVADFALPVGGLQVPEADGADERLGGFGAGQAPGHGCVGFKQAVPEGDKLLGFGQGLQRGAANVAHGAGVGAQEEDGGRVGGAEQPQVQARRIQGGKGEHGAKVTAVRQVRKAKKNFPPYF